ncbi:MAG: histidine triad nucleotide-binding protein [Candidatus Aquicultor secundus]|uniref:Histidine triad nucleotide-binding protein n=1 Tax=Candidatus Aquicultor secundus TaxID=1973895 RepID=A0A2M7T9N9_9ACTN|nr:histidine triad nucleotide-binding protein [Candidatus Aquicultor secundus]NCO65294.1 histidine triad nucleotide-binding protein [Solirubrobacter sp.]OIO87207.1 MAG: histidine triad nucleotide-binding protein [Candidatus Aquicultor secundus]PIU27811.1 MAG: histidine triad nucleotide-binding protein [Candidatus Aquicultor secundus]PIY38375.1 MAG: histidine triad nucleotide-binding protein [Candidatus Aquicultor secundus]PIZ41400.1 MAG: histidine triad nucleotide-binding protein [Candidatus A
MNKDIFCKIAAGEIPADIVYEDDYVVAFRDIQPQSPVHVIIIPRKHIAKLTDTTQADAELLGRILLAADNVARITGIAQTGFRLIANTGPDAGQEVDHVHFHVMGGEHIGPMRCLR